MPKELKVICLLLFLGLMVMFFKTPQIKLPRQIQHKTIGELPVFEMMDDGDFYEQDGMEGIYYSADECRKRKSGEECLKECLNWIDYVCGKPNKCTTDPGELCKAVFKIKKPRILVYPITGIITFYGEKE